jgi:hypothetical protein
MAEDIMADRLNVLSQYTNQRQHIVQCNVMQEKAITNRYYGEQTFVLFLTKPSNFSCSVVIYLDDGYLLAHGRQGITQSQFTTSQAQLAAARTVEGIRAALA